MKPAPASPAFEFASAGRVFFGRGVFTRVGPLSASVGSRALVVTGRSALSIPAGTHPGFASTADPASALSDSAGTDAALGSTAISTLPISATAATDAALGSAVDPASAQRLSAHHDSAHESLLWNLRAQLAQAGVSLVHYLVRGEPSVAVVDEGARLAAASRCDFVIGLGGGSALDAAKAISALMTNGGGALDYLEIVGGGREIELPAAPFIAIPTTAGTGSEVTRNAVLTEPGARVKASIRSSFLLPTFAIVDPDLTLGLPPELTASTGLDALTQLIEGYLTPRANAMTDLFALEGIARSARALTRAVLDGHDHDARGDLALASLLGGLTLANAGLGAVHGIAAPLGGRHPVPHGIACARLLPHVFELNLRALRARDSSSPALQRMERIGELLQAAATSTEDAGSTLSSTPPEGPSSVANPAGAKGSPFAREEEAAQAALDGEDPSPWRDFKTDSRSSQELEPTPLDGGSAGANSADSAVRLLHRLVSDCHLPGLAAFGVGRESIPEIADGAMRSSSMKANPVILTKDEIAEAIAAALK